MELDPAQNDVRRAKRERRLGEGAACLMCGETDPTVLNSHHVGGRSNDLDLESLLCLNDHARAHEAMREVGARLDQDRSRTKLEHLEAVLRGIATFFALLAQSLLAWAQFLADLVRALDTRFPDWRTLEVVW